jgi:polysaccharide biosynthesis protein PslH
MSEARIESRFASHVEAPFAGPDRFGLKTTNGANDSARLLYFAPHQYWPVNSGSRLRDYQLAGQLAARCSVTFVEMRDAGEMPCDAPENSAIESVVTLEKGRRYTAGKILRGLAGPLPVTLLNCWSPVMAAAFRETLSTRQFDTVQVEGVHLLEYLPVIRQALGAPPVVVDWHNVESELMWRYARNTPSWGRRIAARRTAKLIERAEDRLLNAAAVHTVTSERERKMLLARRPDAHVTVIPNGVDTSFYSAKNIEHALCRDRQTDSRPAILFVGSMDYHANIDAVLWFSRAVWPEIAQTHPDLQFTIVGRDPTTEIRALASERIHVTGTVDDVRPYYASAVAVVVPLRTAGGTRLKILEAMAAGVPVISTRIGAEGIEAEDGIHLRIADSGRQIAEAVREIVSAEMTRTRISQAARALVARIYDWSVIGARLRKLHAELRASHASNFVPRIP